MIRGVAILGVIATHSNFDLVPYLAPGAVGHWHPLQDLLDAGGYGVELFFFLSGWLLALIYRGEHWSPRAYWARRITSIWPLWLVFLGLGLLEYAVLGGHDPRFGTLGRLAGPGSVLLHSGWPFPVALVAAACFLGWFSPLLYNGAVLGGWSIQVEMGHYVVFPWLRRNPFRRTAAAVAVGYASYFACRGVLHLDHGLPVLGPALRAWLRLGLYGTLPYFAAGALASRLALTRDDWSLPAVRAELSRRRAQVAVLGVLLLVGLAVPLPFGRSGIAPFAFAAMLALALALGRIRYIGRAIAVCGFYSYFIYFAHFFVLQLTSHPVARGVASALGRASTATYPAEILCNYALALAISLTLGVLSYRFIERPFLNLGRRVR